MAIYSGFYPLNMVIFHSYVSLPKGSASPAENPFQSNSWSTVWARQWWYLVPGSSSEKPNRQRNTCWLPNLQGQICWFVHPMKAFRKDFPQTTWLFWCLLMYVFCGVLSGYILMCFCCFMFFSDYIINMKNQTRNYTNKNIQKHVSYVCLCWWSTLK